MRASANPTLSGSAVAHRCPGRLNAQSRAFGGLLLVLAALAASQPVLAVEFPGPVALAQDGASLCALSVRAPGENRDLLVSGSGGGFLNLIRYFPTSQSYVTEHRFFVGGEVVKVLPRLGLPASETGLIVATVNPDRVLIVSVRDVYPQLVIQQEVALEEDPGDLAFVGNVQTGPWEIAVALPGIDQIAVLSDAGGDWQVAAAVPCGDRPSSLVALDLDGDESRELVVAQTGPLSGSLGVLRRQPDGSYDLQTVTLAGVTPSLVAAGDIDGDGLDELAVARDGLPEVIFYHEQGGTLTEVERAGLTIAASALHLATLPSGEAGLFTASDERGLLEFAARRAGQWVRLDTYYPGCRPHDFTFADLDGDGLDDLVALGGDGAVLTTMIGNEKPGFWGYPAVSLTGSPGSFASEDLDGDGLQDLLVADASSTTLNLFRGVADGSLTRLPSSWDLGFVPGRLLAVNLDQAPDLELAVLDIIAADLVVMKFSAATGPVEISRTGVGTFPFFLSAGDLDGDLNLDLLVLTQSVPEAKALYGRGDGSIGDIVPFGFDSAADRILPVDLNADGLLDVVATDGVSRVWTRQNSGGRAFINQSFVNAGVGALAMALGDLDGDDDADLVVANRTEHTLSFFENAGNGSLVRRIGGHAVPGVPGEIVLADFDKDSHLDVLVNLQLAGKLSLVFGVAAWSYSLPAEFVGGPEVTGIDVSDFNLDGVPDILALDRSLLLGLTLLNEDPNLVAVEPSALVSECEGGGMLLRVRPDRPGPWAVEIGAAGVWVPMMSNGQAALGQVDYDNGVWQLRLDRATFRELGFSAGAALQARLSVGNGADRETAVWNLATGCQAFAANELPALGWRHEPWPNPFNPRVQAWFSLARPEQVTAAVYDLAGRQVTVLFAGEAAAGDHLVQWDGRGRRGPAAAGVYFLRVEAGSAVLNHKVMLVK